MLGDLNSHCKQMGSKKDVMDQVDLEWSLEGLEHSIRHKEEDVLPGGAGV